MRLMVELIITIGVLVTVLGFSGWTFTYALKLVLDSEDAVRIDPVPTEQNK